MIIAYLLSMALFSILKIEAERKGLRITTGLHGVLTQNIVILILIAVRPIRVQNNLELTRFYNIRYMKYFKEHPFFEKRD
jgi:hypothetical protein